VAANGNAMQGLALTHLERLIDLGTRDAWPALRIIHALYDAGGSMTRSALSAELKISFETIDKL
jgi:hypothetical protein